MTGYAYSTASVHDADRTVSLSVEIKSYNSRSLEIGVNVPSLIAGLESKIREEAARVLYRGKVEIYVKIKDTAAISVSVNQQAAEAFLQVLTALSEKLSLDEKPSLSMILGFEGVLETTQSRDDGFYWEKLEPLLCSALAALDQDRTREGAAAQTAIMGYLSSLEQSLKTVEEHAAESETTAKERIKERFAAHFADIAGRSVGMIEVENRVYAEIAAFLMKSTIAEEVSRLASHFAEFRAETERNAHPAKKLDFLCQEINREINTIGSKCGVLEVTREVVSMKDALENIREQLRNVE